MRFIAPVLLAATAVLSTLAQAQNILQVATGNLTGKPYTLALLQQLASPTVLGNATFNLLASTLTTQNVTLFAPSDAAFAAALAAIGDVNAVAALAPQLLQYHVSPTIVNTAFLAANRYAFVPTFLGNSSLASINPQVIGLDNSNSTAGVFIDAAVGTRARVIDTLPASNGVIHIIDTVLIPPYNVSTTLALANAANISGVSFRTLVSAANSFNVTSLVNTFTPLTIFAPTDAAFAAVLPLLNATQLAQLGPTILSYHVATPGGPFYFPDSGSYSTLAGENITVVTNRTSLTATVNGARVLDTVLLSNGVAHIIDTVLVPPSVARALGLSNATTTTRPATTAAATSATTSGAATSSAPAPATSAAASASSPAAASPSPARSGADKVLPKTVGLLAGIAAAFALL